jgi:hypothetical protein
MSNGIDHMAGERIWSESVYADFVSPDGTTGFMLRLCRYPHQETSWLWAFAFMPGAIYGCADHYLPCSDLMSPVEDPDLVYEQAGEFSAVFHRRGSRDKPSGAYVTVKAMAHRGPDPPYGSGTEPMLIKARYSSKNPPWRINPYRSEWVGEVTGSIKVNDTDLIVQGLGHWHEQHQKAPRWREPFTYISLRGKDLSLIASVTKSGDLGHLVTSAGAEKIEKIRIDSPARERGIEVTVEGGRTLEGVIAVTHDYSVPVYDRRRPGTLVTARFEDHLTSGCVNDWQMPEEMYG